MNYDKIAFIASLVTVISSSIVAFIFYGPDERKGKSKKVAGLKNLGNTCYLNVIVQGLAASGIFVKWLENCNLAENLQIVYELSNLLKYVNNNHVTTIHSPQRLLDALHQCNWWSGGQQDAHELFQFLISQLTISPQHQASQISLLQPSLLDEDVAVKSLKSKCNLQLNRISHEDTQPFRGLTANHLTCTFCKDKKPITLSDFDSVTLSIPSKSYSINTLENLLENFSKSELVRDVTCSRCSGKVGVSQQRNGDNLPNVRRIFTKQMTISKIPQCLCIHIQRVGWQQDGVPFIKENYIKFPEELNVKEMCASTKKKSKPQNTDERQNSVQFIGSRMLHFHQSNHKNSMNFTERNTKRSTYKLMAAIVHVGNAYSGHFLTYRRAPSVSDKLNNNWLCISDDSVRNATLEEMLGQRAYMLFYQIYDVPPGHSVEWNES